MTHRHLPRQSAPRDVQFMNDLRSIVETFPTFSPLLAVEAEMTGGVIVFSNAQDGNTRRNVDGTYTMSLSPDLDVEDTLVSYIHELEHLRQMRDANTERATHPSQFCDDLLLRTFMMESAAYALQAYFTAQLVVSGVFTSEKYNNIRRHVAEYPDSRVAQAPEEYFRFLFWRTMQTLCDHSLGGDGYFDHVIDNLRAVKTSFHAGGFKAEDFILTDAVPLQSNAERMDDLKKIGRVYFGGKTISDYLSGEDSGELYQRIFTALPLICQRKFFDEKVSFIRDFYAAKDAACAPKGAIIAPKIWVPCNP